MDNQLIKAFIYYLSTDKGLRAKTVKAYESDLILFSNFGTI
ncbi:site-specific integrase [Desertibacillus haloalkaliphilus]|nr:site-specific integrase [Desertibacillus haloalkaliphilus]